MEDSIHVAIRLRPPIGTESDRPIWSTDGFNISRSPTDSYSFDHVFDSSCSTVEVYESAVSGIVEAAMQGYNGTVFAYGATASGKTHTCLGSRVQPGIIIQAINDIFALISKTVDREYMLRLSYMEIYNEKLIDLLANNAAGPGKDLRIREGANGVILVDGLNEKVVSNADAIISMMYAAQEKRHVGQTHSNDVSSRSHTILRLVIESRSGGVADAINNVSCLNIVDLAGSENVAGADSERFNEGTNINKSLCFLAHVISQLSKNQKYGRKDFINFRDSKLTRILQTSLGGNAKTLIICTVSPFALPETTSTLKFASSAKTIKNKPVKNEVQEETELSKHRKKIAELEKQLKERDKTRDLLTENADLQKEKEKLVEQVRRLQTDILTASAVSPHLNKAQLRIRRQTWCPGAAGNRIKVKTVSYSDLDASSADAKATNHPSSQMANQGRLSSIDQGDEDYFAAQRELVPTMTNAMIESESVECNAVSNDGNEHDNAATVSALRAANADLQSQLNRARELLAGAMHAEIEAEMRRLIEANRQLMLDKSRMQANIDQLIESVEENVAFGSRGEQRHFALQTEHVIVCEAGTMCDGQEMAISRDHAIDIDSRNQQEAADDRGGPASADEEMNAKTNEEIMELNCIVADLKRRLESSERLLAEAVEKGERSERRCGEVEQRVEDDQHEIEELKKAICDWKKRDEEMAEKLRDCEQREQKMKDELMSKERAFATITAECDDLRAALSKAEIATMRDDAGDKRAVEMELMRREIESEYRDVMDALRREHETEIERMQDGMRKMEENVQGEKIAIERLQMEKTQLEEKLNNANAMVDRLTMEMSTMEKTMNCEKMNANRLRDAIAIQSRSLNAMRLDLVFCKEQAVTVFDAISHESRTACERALIVLEAVKREREMGVKLIQELSKEKALARTQLEEIEKRTMIANTECSSEISELRARNSHLEGECVGLMERVRQLENACDEADATEERLKGCNRELAERIDLLQREKQSPMQTVSMEEFMRVKSQLSTMEATIEQCRLESINAGINLAKITRDKQEREKALMIELNQLRQDVACKEEKISKLKTDLRKAGVSDCPFAEQAQSRPPRVWDPLPPRNARGRSDRVQERQDALRTPTVSNASMMTNSRDSVFLLDEKENVVSTVKKGKKQEKNSAKVESDRSSSCRQQ